MTTTKAIYVVAAIVPFGFVALACIGILHVAIGGLRDRRLRRQTQLATHQHAAAHGR
jgi:hypothetical protein